MQPHRSIRARRSGGETGFTLIELLVVITILGILAGIVIFSVSALTDKGDTNARAQDARTLRTAEEAYCAQHGTYASVTDLINGRLIVDRPTYHSVNLFDEKKCGTGPKSSFSLADNTVSTVADGFTAVPGGAGGARGLAVDSDTDKVYVGNSATNNITVINGTTSAILGTIDVGDTSTVLAANPANHKVYASLSSGDIVVITDKGDTYEHTAPIAAPGVMSAATVNPVNNKVYLTGTTQAAYLTGDTNEMRPLSTASGTPVSPWRVNPKTNKVYSVSSLNPSGTRLLIVDGETDVPTTATIQTAVAPETTTVTAVRPVQIDPVAKRIYVMAIVRSTASALRYKLWVINSDTNAVVASRYEAVSTLRRYAIVADPGKNRLWAFTQPDSAALTFVMTKWDGDANAYTVQGPMPAGLVTTALGISGLAIAINPNNNRIYTAQDSFDPAPGGLGVFNTTTLQSTSVVTTPGVDYRAVAVNSNNNRVYALQSTAPGGVQAFK